MARRHLSNPREGEGKGHGRDRRELRALRQRVRDLEAQVAKYQLPGNELVEKAMAEANASIASLEQQAARAVTQRQAIAQCQEKLSAQRSQIVQETLGRSPARRTLRTRLAGLLQRFVGWLDQHSQGGHP